MFNSLSSYMKEKKKFLKWRTKSPPPPPIPKPIPQRSCSWPYMGAVMNSNKVWYVLVFWTTWCTWVQSTIATIHSVYWFVYWTVNIKKIYIFFKFNNNLKVFNCVGDPPPISSHLMQSSFSPPLLNYDIHKQQNKQLRNKKTTLETSKNVLFINNQLCWIELLENGSLTVPM